MPPFGVGYPALFFPEGPPQRVLLFVKRVTQAASTVHATMLRGQMNGRACTQRGAELLSTIARQGPRVRVTPYTHLIEWRLEMSMRLLPRGKWYLIQETGEIYTFWANQNLGLLLGKVSQSREFTFTVTAKNSDHWPLPPGYTAFELDVYQGYIRQPDGTGNFRVKKLGTMSIPAATSYRTATFQAVVGAVGSGNARVVNFVWKNDVWIPGEASSDIQVRSIEVA